MITIFNHNMQFVDSIRSFLRIFNKKMYFDDGHELMKYAILKELLEKINNHQSRICANTEREVLKILEGDCDTAIGTFSKINGNNISLIAELFSVDGKKRYFIKEILV